jgi:hypothetical protein
LKGSEVCNVVLAAAAVAENSWEKMFAAADQNMYWNSQDSLYI